MIGFLLQSDRLGGVVVDLPRRMLEFAGSMPGRIIPNTFFEKMEVIAALLVAQGYLVNSTTDWTSSTGNLPRKRRDITEKMLKAAFNIKPSINQSIL